MQCATFEMFPRFEGPFFIFNVSKELPAPYVVTCVVYQIVKMYYIRSLYGYFKWNHFVSIQNVMNNEYVLVI